MADGIVERLRRHDHDWLPDTNTLCDYCDALYEIERLQAIVATVDDLHSPRLAHDTCLACNHDWPCPTQRLLQEARRG